MGDEDFHICHANVTHSLIFEVGHYNRDYRGTNTLIIPRMENFTQYILEFKFYSD